MKHLHFLRFLPLLGLFPSCSSPPPSEPKATSVMITKPRIEDVPIYLEYPGHIEAYKTVNLQAQITGDLTGMYFKEGEEVKAGQLLFTIDARPYEAALAKAEAALEGSIASLKYSKETVTRYASLAKEQFVSQLNYDEYITNSLESDASVSANRAEVDTAKINLSYCTLYSPMDAIAGKKEIDVGNLVTAAEQTPLIVLNQIDPVFAAFYVPDIDLPKIQKAQYQTGPLKAEIYLNGDKETSFNGYLSLIDNQVDQSTGSIFMKVTLPNQNKLLWPGEFADVRIILSEQKGAILLPAKAVQLGPNGYFAFVISKDLVAEMRLVKIGQRYGEEISILEGIHPDETVVIEGQLNLFAGKKVFVTNAAAETSPLPKTLTSISAKKGLEHVKKQQGKTP
jgi:multidrug efflux system membrane fusion protein